MSAHFPHEQFRLIGADTAEQAVSMWRGALMDRFARIEAAALHCLFAVKADRNEDVPGSCVAWQRFSLLRASTQDPKFAVPARKLGILLDQIDEHRDLRTALAHGVLRQSSIGVEMTWDVRCDGKWEKRRTGMKWFEALDHLVRVDKLARDFSSQTGQIRSICRQSSQSAPI